MTTISQQSMSIRVPPSLIESARAVLPEGLTANSVTRIALAILAGADPHQAYEDYRTTYVRKATP